MPQDLAEQNQLLQNKLGDLLSQLQERRKKFSSEAQTHTKPEEMGEAGKDALKYIRRVFKGEIAKEGLEQIAKDFTSEGFEGPLNYFGAGMIAGPKAISANLDKLGLAKKLKKLGASREKIWKETGWFQYANDFDAGDKGWRFEIPDIEPATKGAYTDLGEKMIAGEELPLGKGLQHEELIRAYPTEVFSSTLSRGGLPEGVRGQFRKNQPPLRGGAVTTRLKDTDFSVLHETSHLVQAAESEFVGGGSPAGIQKLARTAAEDIAQKLRAAKTPDEIEFWRKQLFEAADIAENRAGRADKLYQQIAGEQEARMVQRRARMIAVYKGMGYTDEQIKRALTNQPPWKNLEPGMERKMFAPKDIEEMSVMRSEDDLPLIFKEQGDTHAARITDEQGIPTPNLLADQEPTMKVRGDRLVSKGTRQKPSQRPSHNYQDRLLEKQLDDAQKEMKGFLDQHDYPYYFRKDGSVGVDIYDSEGGVKRISATNMKELRDILGY